MHRWEDDLVRDIVAQADRARTWAWTLTGYAAGLGLLWAVITR